ncbi:MAG: O-methyltransferase [Clostridiales bacterium]|nr:O-methyltransferase [Clostridiales bacterium]
MKYTASLVKSNIDERLMQKRKEALERGVPVADDETLQFLLVTLAMTKPTRILEIGTAVGLSGVAMLKACENAKLTTIELEEERYLEALKNFSLFGVENRVTAHLGDAGEILSMMDGEYDFVFLDGPKAQYEKYLFDLKRVMKAGATLFSDDVLLFGWVSGEEETPQKRRSIVEKIRSYLEVITTDKDFVTSVVNVGDGVALSVYHPSEENKRGKL